MRVHPARDRYRLALLIILALGLLPADAIGQVGPVAVEVRAREFAFAQTLEDRDLDAFLSFVSPEAIFFSNDEPLRGHVEVGRAWAPYFEGPEAPFSWEPAVVVVLESGKLALSSGPVRDRSGNVVGRFNSIWRLDPDGQWRVVFDKGS